MTLPPERQLPSGRFMFAEVAGEPARDSMDAGGVTLRDYLVVARRHKWLVAAAGLMGLALAAFFVSREAPRYRAAASLQLTEERQRLTGGLDAAAAGSPAWGWGVDNILSQIQVLKSRGVLEQVVTDVGLQLQPLAPELTRAVLRPMHVPDVQRTDTLHMAFADDGVRIRSRTGTAAAAFGETVEVDGIHLAVLSRPNVGEAAVLVLPRRIVTERLMEGLQARQREKTTVVDLEFIDHDPVLAQQVVNSTAATFQAFSARAAQQQSRRRREFLEEQLGGTQILLEEAQLALSRFRERETVYSSREKLAAQQAELMQLEIRRGELDADRRMLASLLGTLQQEATSDRAPLQTLIASPALAGSPVVAQLTSQLMVYEATLDSLRSGPWASAESNPDVQRLQAQIATTERRLTDAVRSQLGTLTARIAALDDLRSRSTTALQLLPSVEAEEMRLAEQADGIRTIAEQLREELQRARIAEAVEAGPVEILDLAIVPDLPLGRGRLRKVIFGLMLGVLVGGTGAYMLENMNTSIRRREDLEEHLQVAGLAVVPQFAGDRLSRLRRFAGGVQRRALPGRSAARTNGAHLVTVGSHDAAGAEAYRTLRTNLLFSQAAHELRLIVVTSATPGEGKSTTAANLAVSFAQNGLDVLLIDCDLRRPRLHEFFGLERQPGLTELVLGRAKSGQVLCATRTEKLTVLPSGTLPPNPSEFLGSGRMREVLDEFKQRFEMVILDTPPLLAAADAAPLGAVSDGVVFVIRAGATDRKAAQFALRQLDNVGARVLGAVLNDPNAEAEQYGTYNYSSYYSPAPD
jgi:capsular exopolysaccharide synthesis family protein